MIKPGERLLPAKKFKDCQSVRLVIYQTGDKVARFTTRESKQAARDELLRMGFKRGNSYPHREYWSSDVGMRALIVPE